MKDITNCPHCGINLEENGVYELRVYYHYPESDGTIMAGGGSFEETRFECANCGGCLKFRDADDSDAIQIIG